MTLQVHRKLGAAPSVRSHFRSVSALGAPWEGVSGPHPQVQGWQWLGWCPRLAPLQSVGVVDGEGKARAGERGSLRRKLRGSYKFLHVKVFSKYKNM